MWKWMRFLILLGVILFLTSVESVDIGEGCGETKGCFSDSNGDIKGSYRNAEDPNWVEIELMTNQQGNVYVALGFSTDTEMGEDYVLACTLHNGAVDAFVGVNPQGKDATRELLGIQKQKYLKLEQGKNENGWFYCKSKLMTEVPSSAALSQIKFLNASYYLFPAAGVATGPKSIAMHSHTPKPTKPIKVTDAKYSGLKPVQTTTRATTASSVESLPITEGCSKTKGCFSNDKGTVKMSYRNAEEPEWLDIELMAEGQGNFYAALGFSTDTEMGKDYVVYCTLYDDEVDAFLGVNPSGKSRTNQLTGIQKDSYLKLESKEKKDGRLYCKLKLKKQVPDEAELSQIKNLNQSYHLFLASGSTPSSGKINMHSFTPSISPKIKVNDPKFKPLKPSDDDKLFSPHVRMALTKSHGILMLIGWWFIMTNTILLARYAKKSGPSIKIAKKPLWMGVHMFGNFLGILLTVVAFICIFLMEEGEWEGPKAGQTEPFSVWQYHSLFGLIASIFGFLQPINALLRCNPGTKHRPIFNLIHRFCGIGGWVFATATLWYASHFAFFANYRSATQGLMIFFMASIAIAAIVLEEVWRMIESGRYDANLSRENAKWDDGSRPMFVPMRRLENPALNGSTSPPQEAPKLGLLGKAPLIIIGIFAVVSLIVVIPIAVFIGIY